MLITLLLSLSLQASSVKAGNIAVNIITSMVDDFKTIDQLKKDYINGKIKTYKAYLTKVNNIYNRISSHIDFDRVVKDSLKYDYNPKTKRFRHDHFRGKTLKQKRTFVKKFKALIENITYPLVWEFFEGKKLIHKVVKQTKKEIKLKTIVKRRKRSMDVLWVFYRKNGRWYLYNISVDGEFWITSFRSQFNDIISKKSFKKLLDIMDKKLVEVKEDTKNKLEQDRKRALTKNNS